MTKLILQIPCYNEAEILPETLAAPIVAMTTAAPQHHAQSQCRDRKAGQRDRGPVMVLATTSPHGSSAKPDKV